MGFADIVAALREPRQKPAEKPLGDRLMLIDVNNIVSMSKRLKEVRDAKAELVEEEDRLVAAIMAHPSSRVGYSNDYIKVTKLDALDVEDPQLLEILERKGYMARVSKTEISTTKVRELADEDDEVAKALKWKKGRQVRKKGGKRRDD